MRNELIKKILSKVIIITICVQYLFPVVDVLAQDSENDAMEEIEVIVNPSNDETGVTDTENIQNAVNTVQDNDGHLIVRLSGGNYYINSGIYIRRSNITLKGADDYETIIKYNFGEENVTNDNKDNLIFAAINCEAEESSFKNISIDSISIDMQFEAPGTNGITNKGKGISFVRKKKNVELSNIIIKNCKIQNTYSFGIIVNGCKLQKKAFPDDIETNENDFDEREYYNYYPCQDVTVQNCELDNTRIGIRLDGVENAKILQNKVSNSRYENITMQGNNIQCTGNTTLGDHVGCGSIALDKCDNIKISDNIIDEQEYTRTSYPIYHTGICQNSAAGPTYNCEISNNYIIGAARGIWVKDHRYDSENLISGVTSLKGSRPGAGIIIKNNNVLNCYVTDIRVDEVLLNKVNTEEEVGNSYIINQSHLKLNEEAYNDGTEGHNIKLEDNTYLQCYDVLAGINVTTAPTKTKYKEGQNFETEGMVVTATYDNGTTVEIPEKTIEDTSKDVAGYIVTDGNNLTVGKETVTISYTENGVEKTTTQEITVAQKILTGINVTTAPTKTTYKEEQNFDSAGMVVTATYDNGTTVEIPEKTDENEAGYIVTDGNNLTVGKETVTISYTENGVEKTTTQEITVEEIVETLDIDIDEIYSVVAGDEISYIENIKPSTSIEELLEKIETNGNIEIYKELQKIEDTSIKLATGMKVRVYLDNQSIEYTIVVIGDLNGDGDMGDIDLLKLARYKVGLDTTLEGAYLKAANIYRDDNVGDDIDLLRMARIIAGLDVL